MNYDANRFAVTIPESQSDWFDLEDIRAVNQGCKLPALRAIRFSTDADGVVGTLYKAPFPRFEGNLVLLLMVLWEDALINGFLSVMRKVIGGLRWLYCG
jgi:hypothetical protein